MLLMSIEVFVVLFLLLEGTTVTCFKEDAVTHDVDEEHSNFQAFTINSPILVEEMEEQEGDKRSLLFRNTYVIQLVFNDVT